MKYPNAAKGVTILFWAEIINIIASVIGAVFTGSILASIVPILFSIAVIYGLLLMGKDSKDCHDALMFAIVSIVLNIIVSLFKSEAIVNIFHLAVNIIEIFVLYYTLSGIKKLCEDLGDEATGTYSKSVWNIHVIALLAGAASIIIAIIGLMASSSVITVLGIILLVAAAVLDIIASIKYIILLSKAKTTLNA